MDKHFDTSNNDMHYTLQSEAIKGECTNHHTAACWPLALAVKADTT